MPRKDLIEPYPWTLYSNKLRQRILSPRNGGLFTEEGARQRGMRLVVGSSGVPGNRIALNWLVDEEDGIIADAKFQVWGQSALIGAADAVCELIISKNYDQARRLSAELIDKHLRDRSTQSAFPKETAAHLNLVLEALDDAAEKCRDVPLSISYTAPPAPMDIGEVLEGGYPGWDTFSYEERMALIEGVLDQEVRPYIALDGGGVELLDLKEGVEVLIAYQGNCTSCFSSVGATLSYIQQMLRAKVHPSLNVTPKL